MRVRSITPIRVPDDELERRRSRYTLLSPPGVTVHLDNLADGPFTPWQLDTDAEVASSSDLVLAMALETDPAEFDLVLPDCILDPAVRRGLPEPVPIVGILQLAATHLALLGGSFTAVTRNGTIADELADRVRIYGLDRHFLGVDVLELDLAASQDDSRWNAALAPSRLAAAERGAFAVINGCSAVNVEEGADGVPVVDPTGMALRLLGASALVMDVNESLRRRSKTVMRTFNPPGRGRSLAGRYGVDARPGDSWSTS